MIDYLFEVVGEDSDLCGEQFFVECEEIYDAWVIAQDNFLNEKLQLIGAYEPEEAEILGYDTY